MHRYRKAREAELRPSADDAANSDSRSCGDCAHAGMALPFDRNPRGGPRRGGSVLDQPDAVLRRHVAAGTAAAVVWPAGGKARPDGPGGAARLPAWRLDVDHGLAER